ncbi:hypothetical protein K438DRAFT_1942230 [Mycena galopus ATCC 62051]|nr:hypothetical protein K438DRAFT_1942230 [Mycena galopus ATCC 62051]
MYQIGSGMSSEAIAQLRNKSGSMRSGVHIVAKLQRHTCPANILVPIDPTDLRAVVIPIVGRPHSHPSFPRTKVPAVIQQQYQKCIAATSSIGITTLQVDKALSTREILQGKLPQELNDSMTNSRKRWDLLSAARKSKYSKGNEIEGVGLRHRAHTASAIAKEGGSRAGGGPTLHKRKDRPEDAVP